MYMDAENQGKTTAGFDRIRKIIESSKRRQDDIHLDREKNLTDNTNSTIYCHRDCVSSYTSSYHINRYLKRTGSSSSSNQPLPTTRTWSAIKQFEDSGCMFFWLQGINAAVKLLTQIVPVNSIGVNSWSCFLFMFSDSKELGAVSHIIQI